MCDRNEAVLGKRSSGSWNGDFCKFLHNVRSKREFSDVTFLVEGREFPDHRVILSSCSPFFNNLLSNGFKETKENKISLGEVKADVFRVILEFVYGDSITLNSFEHALETLGCAHRNDLKDL